MDLLNMRRNVINETKKLEEYIIFLTSGSRGWAKYFTEKEILKNLYSFPQIVANAGANYSPALIANYAYELAKEFNQYYHETQILKEPDQDILSMRLVLIDTIARVLRKAMKILGIELPERM